MSLHRLRLVAAVVLTAAASAVVPTSPAFASACSTADGVTVVVDFHELGGGVQQACDPGSGQYAAQRFGDAGFTLTRVQRQPGFVCRVSGAPSDDPCVNTPPADAYWGLWWSDGKSGTWSYASQGVDSLKVPDGGYIALSWNGSSTKSPPGASPSPHAAEPSSAPSSSTPHPSPTGGGSHPSSAPTSPGGSGTPGGTASASPSGSASDDASASTSASKSGKHKQQKSQSASLSSSANNSTTPATPGSSTSPDAAAAPTSDPPGPADAGLPAGVAPAGIALLFAAAAGTAVVRRRRGTSGP